MNIRVTTLYQGSPHGALEIAFNSAPEGHRMMDEIREATGLPFARPAGNRFAMRELHIAEVGGEEALEAAFVQVVAIAEKYDQVHDSQKNMKGPGEVTPNELGKALQDRG
ncbi:MAG: hypothetical protein WCD37_20095 [Chloroflexia bacterium]